MNDAYDIVLVGGGLANGLIALALLETHPKLRLALVERDARIGGEHTWSFHESDLKPSILKRLSPLVSKTWCGYDIRFPEYIRSFESKYHSILSPKFNQVLTERLGSRALLRQTVERISPGKVTLSDGRELISPVIIDGRGWEGPPSGMSLAYQKFLGMSLRLSAPHGLTRPVLMDVKCEQRDGFRFIYLLPWSHTELLVEDTHYSDTAFVDAQDYRKQIFDYVAQQGWQVEEVQGEEQGSLPLPLGGLLPPWPEGVISSGMRAGLFHATTGYSLFEAADFAELIAKNFDLGAVRLGELAKKHAKDCWRRNAFFRLLNRMMFRASEPQKRYKVLQRFYRLPEKVIQKFYAGSLGMGERLRILVGKPPVPILRALKCIFEGDQ